MEKRNQEKGFTLVELAIVLVIIGLIIGGVLVGQDLIKAAEIRTVITDVEKFNAGSTTFRNKYNGYPGDLLDARAENFGLESTNADGTDGRGDGDGILEHGPVAGNKTGAGGENTLFWVHLSSAGMIPFQLATADGSLAVAAATDVLVTDYLPITRLRDSADFHAYGANGRNYFYITAATAITVTTGALTEGPSMSPQEAESVDAKMDDGVPLTGIIRAMETIETPETPGASAAGVCVSSATGNPYDLNEATFDIASCNLRIRTSF